MLLDGHIHMHHSPTMSIEENQVKLINSMKAAGIDGELIIPLDPKGDGSSFKSEDRIDQISKLTQVNNNN